MIPGTSHLFPTSVLPQAKVSCPSSLAKEFRSLKHPSMSSLLSIHPSQTPSTRAHTQPRHSLHSSQSSHPALVLHAVPSLSLPWQHQAQGAASQLGEEREGRGKRGKSWGKKNQIVPKLLEPPPQDEGKVGRAGGAGRLKLPGDGSSRRLISRRCWEATQVSANDFTHCNGGTMERLG